MKKFLIIIIIIILLGAGYYFYIISNNKTKIVKKITWTEIQKNNNEKSCWVVYENKVFNLTVWLDKHPGGKNNILPFCGQKNFEQMFNSRHSKIKKNWIEENGEYLGEVEV